MFFSFAISCPRNVEAWYKLESVQGSQREPVREVPLAQWIARWTSNPKVLGSTPRWDDTFYTGYGLLQGNYAWDLGKIL